MKVTYAIKDTVSVLYCFIDSVMTEATPFYETSHYPEMTTSMSSQRRHDEVCYVMEPPRAGVRRHPNEDVGGSYKFRDTKFFNVHNVAAMCSVLRTRDGKHLPTYPKDDDPTTQVYRVNKGNWGICQCERIETPETQSDEKAVFHWDIKHTKECAKEYREYAATISITPFDRNAEESPATKGRIAYQRYVAARYKYDRSCRLECKEHSLSSRLRIFPLNASTEYLIIDPDSPIKIYTVVYDQISTEFVTDIENFVMNLYDVDYVDYLLPRDADYQDYIFKRKK